MIILKDLLNLTIDKSTLRVSNRESEHREFKLKFERKNILKYAKTMAAFANRDGGVLFFGIKDKPRELIGESEENVPDDLEISNFLIEYFQPEISFQAETLNIKGKITHALIVKPAIRKPIICRKKAVIKQEHGKPDKEVLREGAVYFRYSSSSDEIKFAELRSILDKERESFFRSLVDNIKLLNQVGYDKAAVVNAKELSGNDQIASIYLTNETAKNLNWIDSGTFVEDTSEGKDAYYVIRKVEIRRGVEIPKPTDFAITHPVIKTALMKEVKIYNLDFDAVTWSLGIKDNPAFHMSSSHGKNKIHKYTTSAKDKIVSSFPLDMEDRKKVIKKVSDEYNIALRS